MTRDTARSDPFRELGPMFPPEWLKTIFVPAVELEETPSAYILEADLPGMTEKDVEVSLTGNRLTLSGGRNGEKREDGVIHYACERPHGVFSRSFQLPAGADTERASADLENGVLTVTVPKKPESQPRGTA